MSSGVAGRPGRVQRAVDLFALEVGPSPSPLVERTWWARSVPAPRFISVAAAHWEMVVTRRRGEVRVSVRGPETRATVVAIPAEAEFFGIEFSAGTFMPGLPPGGLVDRAVTLPPAAPGVFGLGGAAWEAPGPDDAEAFVRRLAAAGLLVHDPVVAGALRGEAPAYSARSVQRRVARATGLNHGAIARIRRAERAVGLLSRGVAPADVAVRAGYADQAHLTRSLKRLVGQTPAGIVRPGPGD
jgi:hypothetical protein